VIKVDEQIPRKKSKSELNGLGTEICACALAGQDVISPDFGSAYSPDLCSWLEKDPCAFDSKSF